MQVKSYKLTATIPTGQYANIVPSIEIDTDDIGEAHSLAISHIKGLFETYSEQRLTPNVQVTEVEKLKSFNEDVDVDFDLINHVYTYQGKTFESASGFVSKYEPPFYAKTIADNCEKKWKVPSKEIQELWRSNGRVAAGFGDIIHKALEHYSNNKAKGKIIEQNSDKKENAALPKHPILKKIIQDFEAICNEGELEVLTEVFVTDIKNGRCGQIDRLLIIDREKKICRVRDYKVNVNAEEISSSDKFLVPFNTLPANKLSKYQIQMSYYAMLLENSGWTVEGIDAFVLEDEWKKYELTNISELIKTFIKND